MSSLQIELKEYILCMYFHFAYLRVILHYGQFENLLAHFWRCFLLLRLSIISLELFLSILILIFNSFFLDAGWSVDWDPHTRDVCLTKHAEHLFQQKLGNGNGTGRVAEEIEMKRQLWLKSCRGDENHKKTYGSAFVAPTPNPKILLTQRSSSKLFGKSSDDTQNLLDEMIWDNLFSKSMVTA